MCLIFYNIADYLINPLEKLRKICLAVLIAALFVIPDVLAQSSGRPMGRPRLGLGIDFVFPTGGFGDKANYGYGGSVNYLHPIGKRLNIIGNVGYLRFKGDDIGPFKYTEGYVPIKAGTRYYLTGNIYGEGTAGIAISTANGSGSGTAFAYAPGLGVDFPIDNDLSIELGLKYEHWTRSNGTRSFIGVRAGISF